MSKVVTHAAVFVAWLALFSCCHAESEGDPHVIPLEKVWGYEIPGTQPLKFGRHMATGEHISAEAPIVKGIFSAIDTIKHGTAAKPAFVVTGEGKEALHNAHTVFSGKSKATSTVTSEQELSIVFFSHSLARYVRIVDISHQRREIKINYRFEPHIDAGLTCHFALIPLGKLKPGKYAINVHQLPMEKVWQDLKTPELSQKDRKRVVCQSSHFFVQEASNK